MEHNAIFSEYEKMPYHLKQFNQNSFKGVTWVVTEKAHGANFSFIYDKKSLHYAKRKAVLTWEDDFFAFQTMVLTLEHSIMALFEQLSADIEAEQYIIYGELIGGAYPHTAVKSIPEFQAIQTGIYYCPEVQFYAFDIALKNPNKIYLAYQVAVEYFKTHQLLYAKPLKIGTLQETMAFDLRINSIIPPQLGLPNLDTNLIEGVVIKPWNTNFEEERPIIKLKNPEFEEQQTFHEAQKWSYLPKTISNQEQLAFLVEAIEANLNHNRLQSVVSKIGRLTPKTYDVIKEALIEDVFEDFNTQQANILTELTLEQQTWIRARIAGKLNHLMKV